VLVPPTAALPAVVMLTTRPVRVGEELLFDYNLRHEAANKLEWYSARDTGADVASEAASGSRPV
jgi:hypothetical protein